jgi:hypothetical protein
MDAHRFVEDLDSPVPLLFWDPSEVMLSSLPLGLGIILTMLPLGLLGMVLTLLLVRRLRGGNKRGMVFHRIWRSGFWGDALVDKQPRPSLVEWIG